MKTPVRVHLSRKKGWRMPSNTVKVDRTTRWGNPFIVGRDGSAVKCVYWLILLHAGYRLISCSNACFERQRGYTEHLKAEMRAGYPTLRGKNLACWCKPGEICHAEVLLIMANRPKNRRHRFDLDGFMARFGYRMDMGRAIRICRARVSA
jgi:hypothetical protein